MDRIVVKFEDSMFLKGNLIQPFTVVSEDKPLIKLGGRMLQEMTCGYIEFNTLLNRSYVMIDKNGYNIYDNYIDKNGYNVYTDIEKIEFKYADKKKIKKDILEQWMTWINRGYDEDKEKIDVSFSYTYDKNHPFVSDFTAGTFTLSDSIRISMEDNQEDSIEIHKGLIEVDYDGYINFIAFVEEFNCKGAYFCELEDIYEYDFRELEKNMKKAWNEFNNNKK